MKPGTPCQRRGVPGFIIGCSSSPCRLLHQHIYCLLQIAFAWCHIQPPAELLLRCGLRRSEVAGLKGSDVDKEHLVLHIKGKDGRKRTVEIPADLAEKLNTSKEFLFTPNQTWKSKFYQMVCKAARALGIKVSGLHRLRSNYAQDRYLELHKKGKTDREACLEISHNLGHNRIDVV